MNLCTDRENDFVLTGHSELVQLLLYSGFDPKQKDRFGQVRGVMGLYSLLVCKGINIFFIGSRFSTSDLVSYHHIIYLSLPSDFRVAWCS